MKRVSWILALMALLCLVCGCALATVDLPTLDEKMNLTLPDTWPAWKDYAFEWVQSDAKERLDVSIEIDGAGYGWNSWGENKQQVIEVGEHLVPGTYTVSATAYADGYSAWSVSKEITVTENPDRPAPPKMKFPVDTLYPGLTWLDVPIDPGWEYMGVSQCDSNGDSVGAYGTYVTTDLSIDMQLFEKPGKYSVSVKGKKDGTWSDWSEPIELTVLERPDVSEITIQGPDTFALGESIVYTVLFPENMEIDYVNCGLPRFSTGFRVDEHFGLCVVRPEMLAEYDLQAGEYTMNFTVYDKSGELAAEKKVSFTITGNFDAPTMTAQNTEISSGDKIQLYGEAGSASMLSLLMDSSANGEAEFGSNRTEIWVTPEADGSWSYEKTVASGGRYSFSITGYTNDVLCTGNKALTIIVEDENSLEAPQVTLEESGVTYVDQYIRVFGTAGNEEENQDWYYTVLNEAGETVSSGSMWMEEGRYISPSFSCPEAGTYTFKAYYRTEANWSKMGTISFTVQDWPEIEIISKPDQMYIYGRFVAEVAETDGVQWYQFIIKAPDGTEVFSESTEGTSIRTLSGWYNDAQITDGTYYLQVRGLDDEWEPIARSKAVPVRLVEGVPPTAPVLSVENAAIKENSSLKINLDRNDYEEVQLSLSGENEEDSWLDFYSEPGEGIEIGLGVGKWTVKGRYLSEEGIWSEWSEPLDITVEELPKLDDKISISLPNEWPAYKDYAFEWKQSDARERVHVSLNGYGWDSTDGGEQTIDAESLSPGTYMVSVSAEAEGYAYWYMEKEITVTENVNRPARPNVKLSADNVYLGMERVHAQVDGLWDRFRIRQFDANGEEVNSFFASDNVYFELRYYSEAGVYRAEVKGKKGDTWSDWSEPIVLNMVERPKVEELTIEGPDTIVLGKSADYTILLPEELNAYYVNVYLQNESSGTGNGFYLNDYSVGSVHISASDMVGNGFTAGSYIVNVTVDDDGWNVIAHAEKTVTITGDTFVMPTMAADKAVVKNGDMIRISGNAGAADALHLEYGSYFGWGGVWITPEKDGSWSYERAANQGSGAAEFWVTGYTEDGLCTGRKTSLWVIVEDDDSLEAPEIQVKKDKVYTGQLVYFYGGDTTRGYDHMELSVFNEAGESVRYDWIWGKTEEGRQYYQSFSLPGEGKYTLVASYMIDEVRSKAAELTVSVIPPQEIVFTSLPDEFIIGMPNSLSIEPINDLARYRCEIKTSADSDADIISDLWGTATSSDLSQDIIDIIAVNIEAGEYYYMTITGFDEDYNLIAQSPVTKIRLVAPTIPAPVISLAKDTGTIMEGQPFTIEIQADFNIEISFSGNGRTWSQHYGNPDDGMISQTLPAGEWTLRARQRGIMYDYVSDWSEPLIVTVEGAQRLDAIRNIKIPSKVKAYENFAFSFDPVENAEYYEIVMGGVKYWFNDYGDMITEVSSGKFTGWTQNMLIESGIYLIEIGAFADGYISSYSGQIQILVEAADNPDGVIKLPAGLKELEANALEGVKAAQIIVPDGCVSIGAGAFAGNSELRLIVIPASVTQLDEKAFDGVESDVTIIAPEGSAAAQLAEKQGLEVWSE